MILDEIRRLYEYTDWANERLLAALGTLSEEQYTRQVVSSFPSIRATLGHIAGSEWVWLQRWTGSHPTAQPGWSVDAPLRQIAENVRATASGRRKYLEQLQERDLDGTLTYRNLKGQEFANRLGDMLFHVVNHSSSHRGQLITMIRQVGATPPSLDLIVFHRERRS